jgi:hypothetical protein
MGQGQSNAGPASPRNALKNKIGHVGKIARAHSDVHVVRNWSAARFTSMTNFIDSKDELSVITELDFKDPCVALMFQYIFYKRLGLVGGIKKSQYIEAMTSITQLNTDEMTSFVSEAMIYMYNRMNRLHPHLVDASTIRTLNAAIPKDYDLGGMTLEPSEINQFFESNTGKKTGALTVDQTKSIMKSAMDPTDFKIINKNAAKKTLRAPHLHPSRAPEPQGSRMD